jgi:transposase
VRFPADRRGGPSTSKAEEDNERLRQENERLAGELAKTKAALDIVGKAYALLELLSESADSDRKSTR